MKEVVVLSGKGGTGKTSIVGSFAALAKGTVLADCDVDAADLHLILQPVVQQRQEFWSGQVAAIDESKCTQCGLCQELCRFKAIRDFKVDRISCEGCGFCYYICPAEAITMEENLSGHWFISDTKIVVTVEDSKVVSKETRAKAGHHTFAASQHPDTVPGERHGYDAGSQVRHASMMETITDCQVLLAGGMGWGAYENLKSRGIETVVTDVEDIEEAVKLYLQGKLPNLMERLH